MTWASYIEYTTMVLDGRNDAITRNYDLANLNGTLPGKMLDRACERMGLAQRHTLRTHIVPLVRRMMMNVGIEFPHQDEILANHIRHWYTWDRITKGELRQWPMQKPPENLSLI